MSSKMEIRHTSGGGTAIPFSELGVGDVFRADDGDLLYLLIHIPTDTSHTRQGVSLSSGGRRIFTDDTPVVRVRLVLGMMDVKP